MPSKREDMMQKSFARKKKKDKIRKKNLKKMNKETKSKLEPLVPTPILENKLS